MQRHIVLVGILVGVILGCSGTTDPPKCVPNQVVSCGCANGQTGAQACGEDGVFGPCTCEPAPAQRCTQGAVVACACSAGATGTQTCGADGAFGACSCGTPLECPSGFARAASGNCVDVDECAATPAPCAAQANCINTQGSHVCVCRSGFTGDGVTCTANECLDGTHQCSPNARCVDTTAGYDCLCLSGWIGDGRSCVNVDECAAGLSNCDADATCVDTPGSFVCRCPSGFTGDGLTCVDVDECAMGMLTCTTSNSRCVNTPGSAACECLPGYGGPTCTNINECNAAAPPCGQVTCEDLPGSYRCVCPNGMTFSNQTCVDVDECASAPDCDVNATCTNVVMTPLISNQTFGHFCSCNAGFDGNGLWCLPSTTTTVQMFTGNKPRLIIAGVGDFDVGGLSRLGMDFDFSELANPLGGTRKFPTVVHIPNLTVRALAGAGSSINSLNTWALASPGTSRDMTLEVRGIGPEVAGFNLFGVRVVSHGVVDGSTYTELVLSISSIQENFWEGARDPWPCPTPGWMMEVSGYQGPFSNGGAHCGVPATTPNPMFRNNGLTLPVRRDSAVALREVPVGRHFLSWFRSTMSVAQTWGVADERDLSIIRFDETSQEYFRVNGYQMWPASITLFNPDRPYQSAPLVDVVLVCSLTWERA